MSDYRLVYVLNPVAGKGKYLPDARRSAEEAHADVVHITERQGECIDFIAESCLRDPHTHFVVYGGDGTAGEAATGIMRAGAGSHAILSIRPCGSGNDFVRGIGEFPLPEGEDARWLDLISVNGRYAINMMNAGFDCDVVENSEKLRRSHQMPNGLSYIVGVGTTLSQKKVFHGSLKLFGVVDPATGDVRDEEIEDDFLIVAAANLPYYGGGFKAAPAADPSDGLMDVMVIRDLSRMKFVSLVGGYRTGKYLNPETLVPYPQYRSVIEYRKCRTLRLDGAPRVCLDGEIILTAGIHADIVPRAIRVK